MVVKKSLAVKGLIDFWGFLGLGGFWNLFYIFYFFRNFEIIFFNQKNNLWGGQNYDNFIWSIFDIFLRIFWFWGPTTIITRSTILYELRTAVNNSVKSDRNYNSLVSILIFVLALNIYILYIFFLLFLYPQPQLNCLLFL